MLENYNKKENNIFIKKNNQNYSFNYSDGEESERFLMDVLGSSTDLSSNSIELGRKSKDWPSYYHLSPRRSNLLRPLKEKLQEKTILEIGAGCGAITRYLGETGKSVVSIEGSPVRSHINSLRTQGLQNVSIVCDNYQDYETNSQFDVATLIGVLEYSRIYFRAKSAKTGHAIQESPELGLLKKIHSQLNDSGSLILAIENKLGLKYLAGYPEDHLGIPMYGVEGLYNDNTAVTFGKVELKELLESAGFSNVLFYYPFPDYKVPTSVLCEDLIHHQDHFDLSYILQTSEKQDPQKPEYTTMNLNMVWKEIYKNKLWQDLSNSFLVIASKIHIQENNLAYHYSIERDPEFQKEIHFTKSGEVVKKSTQKQPDSANLDVISAKPYSGISNSQIRTPFHLKLENEKYFQGVNWELELIRIMNTPGWNIDHLVDWMNTWIECIKKIIHYTDSSPIPLDHSLEGKYLDAIPRNLIYIDREKFEFIDLEWNYNYNLKFSHILFRSLFTTIFEQHYIAVPDLHPTYGLNKWNIAKKLLIRMGYWVKDSDIHGFLDQELEFQRQISSNYSNDYSTQYWLDLEFEIKMNLSRAISSLQSKDQEIQAKNQEVHSLRKSWSFRVGYFMVHPWKIPYAIWKRLLEKKE